VGKTIPLSSIRLGREKFPKEIFRKREKKYGVNSSLLKKKRGKQEVLLKGGRSF